MNVLFLLFHWHVKCWPWHVFNEACSCPKCVMVKVFTHHWSIINEPLISYNYIWYVSLILFLICFIFSDWSLYYFWLHWEWACYGNNSWSPSAGGRSTFPGFSLSNWSGYKLETPSEWKWNNPTVWFDSSNTEAMLWNVSEIIQETEVVKISYDMSFLTYSKIMLRIV